MGASCTHLNAVKTDRPKTRGCEECHPIMSSAEPGETWSWCYVDEVALELR